MNKIKDLIDLAIETLKVYIDSNKPKELNKDSVVLYLNKYQYNYLLQIADIDRKVQYHLSDVYFNCDHFGCAHCKRRGACYFTSTIRELLGLPSKQDEYEEFKKQNPDKVARYKWD
jgi:hypothetical protein